MQNDEPTNDGPTPAPTEKDLDYSLRLEELGLRKREVVVKEQELKLNREGQRVWRNPVFIGLMAATLSLIGNAASTIYQADTARVLANKKLQNDLVFSALNTADPKIAAQRLAFLLNLHYINDDHFGTLRRYIDHPELLPLGTQKTGDHPPWDSPYDNDKDRQ